MPGDLVSLIRRGLRGGTGAVDVRDGVGLVFAAGVGVGRVRGWVEWEWEASRGLGDRVGVDMVTAVGGAVRGCGVPTTGGEIL